MDAGAGSPAHWRHAPSFNAAPHPPWLTSSTGCAPHACTGSRGPGPIACFRTDRPRHAQAGADGRARPRPASVITRPAQGRANRAVHRCPNQPRRRPDSPEGPSCPWAYRVARSRDGLPKTRRLARKIERGRRPPRWPPRGTTAPSPKRGWTGSRPHCRPDTVGRSAEHQGSRAVEVRAWASILRTWSDKIARTRPNPSQSASPNRARSLAGRAWESTLPQRSTAFPVSVTDGHCRWRSA